MAITVGDPARRKTEILHSNKGDGPICVHDPRHPIAARGSEMSTGSVKP